MIPVGVSLLLLHHIFPHVQQDLKFQLYLPGQFLLTLLGVEHNQRILQSLVLLKQSLYADLQALIIKLRNRLLILFGLHLLMPHPSKRVIIFALAIIYLLLH